MPADSWETLTVGLLSSLTLMVLLWALQLRTGDAGVVDVGWAASIALLAVGYGLVGDGSPAQRWLAAAVGGLWGGRLAIYLLIDRILSGREDGRYAYLRRHWGAAANRQFLWFFAAQAGLAVLLSVPFLLIAGHPAVQLAPVQVVGLVVVTLAVVGEGIADRQLARFRADPANRGRTCRLGMWRYSRHPNYFCEWLVWCGVALLAWPTDLGPWMLAAPAAMYLFVTRLTGIPYTEAQSLRSRGDDYRAYQRETNAFFPGPWRRDVAPATTDSDPRTSS